MRFQLLCIKRHSLIRRFISYQRKPVLEIAGVNTNVDTITIMDKSFKKDEYTNLTPRIANLIGQNLHNVEFNPLCLVKKSIIEFFHQNFIGRTGNSIFSVYDNISPVVSVQENFDSLLIPDDHPSRSPSDSYYLNKNYLLRSHTTAHQYELIKMGLDNFLLIGDVYRRDVIDSTHYPVFHQADAIYSLNESQLQNQLGANVKITGNGGSDTDESQACYSIEATKYIENHLKRTLEELVKDLYRECVTYRWVTSCFPFTHPSWELEIELNGKWVEILGCGIIKNDILKNAGAGNRIGWAFGVGLERLAMHRYQIPDIRIFWSTDSGNTSQFDGAKHTDKIIYEPVSIQPQCKFDMSFFVPEGIQINPNDVYDLVRSVGGDFVEQVNHLSDFFHPTKKLLSQTYRIIYRHMDRPLTKDEVNIIHLRIGNMLIRKYGVEIRR